MWLAALATLYGSAALVVILPVLFFSGTTAGWIAASGVVLGGAGFFAFWRLSKHATLIRCRM